MEKLVEKVYCRSCGGKRNHNIISQHKEESTINDKKTGNMVVHSILKCAGCETVTYADILSDLPMIDKYGKETKFQYIVTYPNEPEGDLRILAKLEITCSRTIPYNISELYTQLVTSYNMRHNVLCAIGLRTLIEAICNELNITKGYKYDSEGNTLTNNGKKESIEGKVYGLFENKYIVWYETLILQKIREIGNAAAHELVTPSSEELHSAIGIIERLLETIYHLPNHKLLKK